MHHNNIFHSDTGSGRVTLCAMYIRLMNSYVLLYMKHQSKRDISFYLIRIYHIDIGFDRIDGISESWYLHVAKKLLIVMKKKNYYNDNIRNTRFGQRR